MKHLIITLLAICYLALPGLCLTYYESSGRTVAFTLKAGAKAGPTAVRKATPTIPQAVFRVAHSGNRLSISNNLSGTLKLYRLNGRLIGTWQTDRTGIIVLNRHLSSDVYFIRFEGLDGTSKAAKLAVLPKAGR